MFFGGAFFDPSPRSERRMSLGGFVSSAGIFLGGLILFVGVLEPWTASNLGPLYPPRSGLAVASLGWLLVVVSGALCVGGLAEMVSHSRPFNLGLQLFAIPAGITALVARAFTRPCLPAVMVGNPRPTSIQIQRLLHALCRPASAGVGYSVARSGAIIVIASATIVLAISGITTMWVRRHCRKPLVA